MNNQLVSLNSYIEPSADIDNNIKNGAACWEVFIPIKIQIGNIKNIYNICRACNSNYIDLNDKKFDKESAFEAHKKKYYKNKSIYKGGKGSSTSNMGNHDCVLILTNGPSNTIDQYVGNVIQDPKIKLVEWLFMDNLSFSTVESPYFKEMIDAYRHSNSKLIKADQCKNEIKKRFISMLKELIEIFEVYIESFSATMDIVQGPHSREEYFGVGASFIINYVHYKIPLGLETYADSHSGVDMGKCFCKIVKSFGILGKLISTSSDSFSGNLTAVDYIEEEIENDDDHKAIIKYNGRQSHHNCMSHSNSRCALAAVHQIPEVEQIADVLLGIRNNKQLCVSIKEIEGSIPPGYIKNEIRWNSHYYGVKWCLKHYKIVSRAAVELDLPLPNLNKVKLIVEFLKVFKDATKIVSRDEFSLSEVLPLFSKQFKYLEMVKREGEESNTSPYRFLVKASKAALGLLSKYYDFLSSKPSLNVSMILDKNAKERWMEEEEWEEEWKETAREDMMDAYKIFKEAIQDSSREISVVEPVKPDEAKNKYYKKMYTPPVASKGDEYEKYKDSIITEAEFYQDSLEYWSKQNSPVLQKMISYYGHMEPTSVWLERSFCVLPDMITANRASLDPETIRMCYLLREWTKFFNLFKENNIHKKIK